ncbi:hypothetical protein P7K49_007489 [Saguinus oedipus]|uniref:Uncharacterized protein n=1 Tax=Saguinus oedipus TaxID=9490 RepID=A0ABQ9VV09_SAGOE|nr:hypothetical protein P7K49_007489 [Saguinus oedipus]
MKLAIYKDLNESSALQGSAVRKFTSQHRLQSQLRQAAAIQSSVVLLLSPKCQAHGQLHGENTLNERRKQHGWVYREDASFTLTHGRARGEEMQDKAWEMGANVLYNVELSEQKSMGCFQVRMEKGAHRLSQAGDGWVTSQGLGAWACSSSVLGVDKSLPWEFSSMALQHMENYANSEELDSYIHNKFNITVKHHY